MDTRIETKVDPLPVVKGKQLTAWLKYDDKEPKDDRPQIRTGMTESNRGIYAGNAITIRNMTTKELEAVESFMNGASYLRIIDGRLHAYYVHEQSPSPVEDPLTTEHWPRAPVKLRKMSGVKSKEIKYAPGLMLSGLGAGISSVYGYPKDETLYKRMVANDAASLEDCGFTCLRSRRKRDGTVSELWVLNSLYSARGVLRQHIDSLDEKLSWGDKGEAACRFIARDMRIHFATLDLTSQRWALCNPD